MDLCPSRRKPDLVPERSAKTREDTGTANTTDKEYHYAATTRGERAVSGQVRAVVPDVPAVCLLVQRDCSREESGHGHPRYIGGATQLECERTAAFLPWQPARMCCAASSTDAG
eukprot:3468631-Rhodomonas_salina.4